MDRERIKDVQRELFETDLNWYKVEDRVVFVKGCLQHLIYELLNEPKPVATETGMDKRTRMKKLILEMLEIV